MKKLTAILMALATLLVFGTGHLFHNHQEHCENHCNCDKNSFHQAEENNSIDSHEKCLFCQLQSSRILDNAVTSLLNVSFEAVLRIETSQNEIESFSFVRNKVPRAPPVYL